MAVNRIGLTRLDDVKSSEPRVVDIVMVHGLFGHPKDTWTYKTSKSKKKKELKKYESSNSESEESEPKVQPTSWKQKLRFKPQKSKKGKDHVDDIQPTEHAPQPQPTYEADLPSAVGPADESDSAESDSHTSSDAPEARAGGHPAPSSENKSTEFRTNDAFWPKDLLATQMKNARVYTWGYEADVAKAFDFASQSSIYEHAKQLLSDLADEEDKAPNPNRRIVFVTHSLGGLIVKDALTTSSVSKLAHLKRVQQDVVGVCFLGTPHRGSSAASMGKIAFNISKIAYTHANTNLLKSLERNSETLDRIGDGFANLLYERNFKIHSFRETKPMKGVMIVEPYSAQIGVAEEGKGEINKNHSEMTRFCNESDMGFVRVLAVLRRWVSEAGPSKADLECLLRSLDVPITRVRSEAVQKVFPGTFEWVFTDDTPLSSWLESSTGRVFWIQGYAGSGKSTIMKFIREDKRTRELLKMNTDARWLFGEYFFHDRGSEMQKSIIGLLTKLLHDLLSQNPTLARFLPVFSANETSYGDILFDTTRLSSEYWNEDTLKASLGAILAQGKGRSQLLCVCIFVDALDEHGGPHRELLSTLDDLFIAKEKSTSDEPEFTRIKLCIASRPENEFVEKFERYGTFQMKNHTAPDISNYAKQRFKTSDLSEQLKVDRRTSIEQAVTTIVRNAQGIFIWVRLVIDEVLDGLLRGELDSELLNILQESPHDLSKLYIRSMLRMVNKGNFSESRKLQFGFEAYCTFQMVLCSHGRLGLRDLMRKVSSVSAELIGDEEYKSQQQKFIKQLDADAEAGVPAKISVRQLKLRMTSRSAGLLEYLSPTDTVQFIHQTAKQNIQEAIAKGGLLAILPSQLSHLEGYEMLFLSHLSNLLSKKGKDVTGFGDMIMYAFMTEDTSKTCLAKQFQRLEKVPTLFETKFNSLEDQSNKKGPHLPSENYESEGLPNYDTPTANSSDPLMQFVGFGNSTPPNLMSFAIMCRLHLTVADLIANSRFKYIKKEEDFCKFIVLAAGAAISTWPESYWDIWKNKRFRGDTRTLECIISHVEDSKRGQLVEMAFSSFIGLLDESWMNRLVHLREEAICNVLRLFIAEGIDPNKVVKFRTLLLGNVEIPLLHWAASSGLILVVHVLANLGADIKGRDSTGRCVLEFAKEAGTGTLMQQSLVRLRQEDNDEDLDAVYYEAGFGGEEVHVFSPEVPLPLENWLESGEDPLTSFNPCTGMSPMSKEEAQMWLEDFSPVTFGSDIDHLDG